MDIDEDTDWWLGSPTPLEMCKQHALMLENEYQEQSLQLRKARQDIQGLIRMNDALSTGKALAETALKKELANIARLNLENSELGGKVRSLEMVASQRDYLFRENQRLLMDLSKINDPQL